MKATVTVMTILPGIMAILFLLNTRILHVLEQNSMDEKHTFLLLSFFFSLSLSFSFLFFFFFLCSNPCSAEISLGGATGVGTANSNREGFTPSLVDSTFGSLALA